MPILNKYNMSQFVRHAHDMANVGDVGQEIRPGSQEDLLRFWEAAKSEYLYKMFGEELILTRSMRIEQSASEITDLLERVLRNHHNFRHELDAALKTALHPVYSKREGWFGTIRTNLNEDAHFIDCAMKLFNDIAFNEGLVRGESSATVVGTQIQLTPGQKAMRALGKIARAVNLEKEFEEFRLDHSRALNQRYITGELCLSIHPLDYATASDNANDWTSCMSWREDGCYRLGTVEMMNSPMVICAYLKGKNTIEVGGNEWNSKKWRAWVIVTKDIIIMNKQYPYTNDSIATAVLNWVIELAGKNLGWKYAPVDCDLDYNEKGFDFETGFMYNDFGRDTCYPGALGDHYRHGDICFSGVANCMWCGQEIEYSSDDGANTLCCESCEAHARCSCCGEILYDGDAQLYDGEWYCYDCFNDTFKYCDACDEYHLREDVITVAIPFSRDLLKKAILENADVTDDIFRSYSGYDITTGKICCDTRFMPTVIARDVCRKELARFGLTQKDLLYGEFAFPDGALCDTHLLKDPTKMNFADFVRLFHPYQPYCNYDGSAEKVWEVLFPQLSSIDVTKLD